MRPRRWALVTLTALVVSSCALGTGIGPRADNDYPWESETSPLVVEAASAPAGGTADGTTADVAPEPTAPGGVTTTTASPTTTTTEDRSAFLAEVGANEAGAIMVLEYHLIESPEGRWARTPANLRSDVNRLIAEGYFPITTRDLAKGWIDVLQG